MSHFIYTTFAMLSVAAIISFAFIWYYASLVETKIEVKTTQDELNKIAIVRIAEECLKFGEEKINVSKLNENNGKKICDLCKNLCSAKSVWIRNLESGYEWVFDKKGDEKASLLTNIVTESGIDVGRIYVET